MKRLIAIAGAAAMLLSTATPAFASIYFPMGSSDINNFAMIDNTAVAKSSTGDNVQFGSSNWLVTGIALSDSTAVVVANTNVRNCSSCWSTGDIHNFASIDNKSIAKSDTGDNFQTSFGGWFSTGNHEITGNAGSTANAWTVVNTNLSF